MTESLLDAVLRHARTETEHGAGTTALAEIATVCIPHRTELVHAIQRPLVCLVLQGVKQVTMGQDSFTFKAGDSMLLMAHVPTASQIVTASAAKPYCSLIVDLDPATIAELAAKMPAVADANQVAVKNRVTDDEVADAALRLVRLLDRPDSVPFLKASLLREFHYWLLAGRHGAAVRQIGTPHGRMQRIARAIALLRTEYATRLPVERLAAEAGMSASTFHQNFRSVTSMTPLQFQKQLRLIEARRLMLAEGANASNAAFAVGYESVPQFTREYGRLFGQPPVRDIAAVRAQLHVAA